MAVDIDIDDILESQSSKKDFYQRFSKDLKELLNDIGIEYAKNIADEIRKDELYSSGKGLSSIKPLKVRVEGKLHIIEIEYADYLKYNDFGVDGWAKSKGGAFKFKTKGVGEQMRKSLEEYVRREGLATRSVKQKSFASSKREKKGLDLVKAKANSLGFMIKRMGIEPKNFSQRAAAKTYDYAAKMIGEQVKLSIVNNFVQ